MHFHSFVCNWNFNFFSYSLFTYIFSTISSIGFFLVKPSSEKKKRFWNHLFEENEKKHQRKRFNISIEFIDEAIYSINHMLAHFYITNVKVFLHWVSHTHTRLKSSLVFILFIRASKIHGWNRKGRVFAVGSIRFLRATSFQIECFIRLNGVVYTQVNSLY